MVNMSNGPDATTSRGDIPRGGDGKFIATADTAERDAAACRLRRDGHSFEAIAAALGYATKGAAHRAVQRALLAIVREPAEDLRTLELERLDYLYLKVLKILEKRHIVIQHGKVVTHEGVPVEDDAPTLSAVAHLLKIQERRAKLLGLDAPKQIEVLTLDTVQAEIRRLEQTLNARALDTAKA